MSVQLRPSFARAILAVLIPVVGVATVAYLWEGYHEQHWWTRDYIVSLMIPFTFLPLLAWLMFVPTRLAFSKTQFTIQFPFRSLHTVEWTDLEWYGPEENVFVIQFSRLRKFQILAQAFPSSEWRMLENFLSTTYPERKA